MDELATEAADPRDEIARLEARIEALADKIEGCRKFMVASRIAVAAGCVVLGATIIGMIAFDPTIFLGAVAAVLGGFVLLGSIELRVVGGRETLH
jgi:hypothetical protein